MQCPNCRNEVRGRFCPTCGTRLKKTERGTQETPHFRIHYTAGSFADQNMASICNRLEGAFDRGRALLGVDLGSALIEVHLSELMVEYQGMRLGGGGYAIPRRLQIHDVFLPDSPGESLERSLLHILLALAIGQDRPISPFIMDGLLPRIARPTPPEPDPSAAGMLGAARSQGQLPPLGALLRGPVPGTEPLYYPASVLFTTWVLETYGIDRLKQFVLQLDPENPDAAANGAFGKTLDQVDKAWARTLKGARPSGVMRFIRQSSVYLRPYWLKVAEIVLYLLISVLFTVVVMSKSQQFLMDKAILQKNLHNLFLIMGVLVGAFIVMSLTSLRQSFTTASVSGSVMKDLRLRMFSLVQHLHPGFFATTGTGDILSRMTSDLDAVEFAITGAMVQMLRMVLTLILALITVFTLNWQLASLTVLISPLFFVASRFLGPRTGRASMERQQQLGRATTTLQENLGAQPVVKAFGLQRKVIADYTERLQQVFQASLRLTFLSGVYGLTANSIGVLVQLSVLGIGGYLFIEGHTTIGTITAFMGLVGQVIGPVQGLSGIMQALNQATGAMDRVDEMLAAKPAIADKPGAPPLPRLSQGIRLEHVTFGYTESQANLRNVSLEIPAGMSVAFVGPSGCGKSTVLNLLMRFYDPQQGQVSFDGMDVRDATLDSVRDQMGVVFQENVLFNTTIRENIRMGRLEASDAEVEAAAHAAEIHDIIMSMPQGYETMVGERGGQLSGGQRQRIAIARAIVRNPSILILDEATSALDPRTESALNATLERLGRGRTTISVTHRLASTANMDRIFVLDRGQLVEQGTYGELMGQNGLFAKLVQDQGGFVAGGQYVGADASRLQNVPLFADLQPELLASLAQHLMTERYAAGEIIIKQGDVGDKLYIVRKGEVEVLGSDPAAGGRPLAVLREGDYFGEMALLRDEPRTATVRARTPVQTLTLGKDDFIGLLSAVPPLRRTLEHVMAERGKVLRAGAPAAGQ